MTTTDSMAVRNEEGMYVGEETLTTAKEGRDSVSQMSEGKDKKKERFKTADNDIGERAKTKTNEHAPPCVTTHPHRIPRCH